MATINSIDGIINSGGDNPSLGVEFPTTIYKIQFPANAEPNKLIPAYKASITYVNEHGQIRTWNMPSPDSITANGMTYAMVLTDRIKKVLTNDNVKLTDQGLAFNIPLIGTAPKFINLIDVVNKELNVKKFKVYFGTPSVINGSISYIDELGVAKTLSLKGTTADITTTKITNYFNVRLEDLNPDVAMLKPIARPPIGFQAVLSLATGTYGTISSPVAALSFLNAPVVPLISGGSTPELFKYFAATLYDIDFPETGTGSIEYIDSNGKAKSYTLNKFQIFTPNGLLSDSIIQITKLENVKLIDKGLMYQIQEPVNPNWVVPASMPILPTKAKYYQVYFGNPVYPQGSIIYFDSKGANKMLTNFGKVVTIDAINIYRFSNVRIIEVGIV